MTPAIEGHGITKTYGAETDQPVEALKGIDLSVPEGQIFGYLGRNGQGKSTTVRILTGLSLPTAGTARVAGLDVVTQRRDVQAQIGVTLQDVALDDLQTGREHLVLVSSLWGHSRRAARAKADELLEEFGLTAAAGRLIRNYSGGMRRRLDLATSLLNEPRVLFLDEPTTGLDPQSRRALWGRIRQLRTDGATVFLTTQYLEEADELADELAIIDRGEILAQGTPDQLRSSFGTTRVSVRLDDPATRAKAHQTLGEGVEPDAAWLRFEVAEPSVAAQRVSRLGADGITPDEISVHTSSLEDVFLDLTGTGINGNTEPADATQDAPTRPEAVAA